MEEFDDAKVGDKVWDFFRGRGKIIVVTEDTITVEFEEIGHSNLSIWKTGKQRSHEINQRLFHDEVKIDPPERPKEKCGACELLMEYENLEKSVWVKTSRFLLDQQHTCSVTIEGGASGSTI